MHVHCAARIVWIDHNLSFSTTEERRAEVKKHSALAAHAQVEQLVSGLLTLLKKVESTMSKVLIMRFTDIIIQVALNETSKFSRPMRQLVRRFDILQEKMIESLRTDEKEDEESLYDIYLSKMNFATRLRSISRTRQGTEALSMQSNCARTPDLVPRSTAATHPLHCTPQTFFSTAVSRAS